MPSDPNRRGVFIRAVAVDPSPTTALRQFCVMTARVLPFFEVTPGSAELLARGADSPQPFSASSSAASASSSSPTLAMRTLISAAEGRYECAVPVEIWRIQSPMSSTQKEVPTLGSSTVGSPTAGLNVWIATSLSRIPLSPFMKIAPNSRRVLSPPPMHITPCRPAVESKAPCAPRTRSMAVPLLAAASKLLFWKYWALLRLSTSWSSAFRVICKLLNHDGALALSSKSFRPPLAVASRGRSAADAEAPNVRSSRAEIWSSGRSQTVTAKPWSAQLSARRVRPSAALANQMSEAGTMKVFVVSKQAFA
mmetsp:Transcript_68355/g.177943  ORF Transcript_68355/g.177943 Transcript_68355/m.177943 type:complete len:308 (+) Transcript_68355:1023-1946(+)